MTLDEYNIYRVFDEVTAKKACYLQFNIYSAILKENAYLFNLVKKVTILFDEFWLNRT